MFLVRLSWAYPESRLVLPNRMKVLITMSSIHFVTLCMLFTLFPIRNFYLFSLSNIFCNFINWVGNRRGLLSKDYAMHNWMIVLQAIFTISFLSAHSFLSVWQFQRHFVASCILFRMHVWSSNVWTDGHTFLLCLQDKGSRGRNDFAGIPPRNVG